MKKLTTIITGLSVLVALTVAVKSRTPNHPTTDKEIAATTAMITNMKGNSGGTGVILKSGEFSSTVLTNAHVCGVVKFGGAVTTDRVKTTVTSYIVSEIHDLCLITVNANLQNNAQVAESSPELYDTVTVSGHPILLPTLLTKGVFSSKEIIDIMTGMRACTKEDEESGFGMLCAYLGGMPIIKTYNAIVSSALIQPGSSGSAAWNASGKIAALVFAGSGNIGYSHLVPVEYINNFLENELADLAPRFPLDNSLQILQGNAEKKLREACGSPTNTLQYEIVKQYCKYVDLDMMYYNDN
jgi:S1-C subfamily serine protease